MMKFFLKKVIFQKKKCNCFLYTSKYYRESPNIGHCLLYNTHRTFKNALFSNFHTQSMINTRNYILNVEKIEEKAILNVLCVF